MSTGNEREEEKHGKDKIIDRRLLGQDRYQPEAEQSQKESSGGTHRMRPQNDVRSRMYDESAIYCKILRSNAHRCELASGNKGGRKMKKIRAIVKRTDEEYGHMTHISNTLENLQRTVGGYIEVVKIGKGIIMICNEEGKLKGLPHNMFITGESIRGDIIICGENGEEFGDLPESFGMKLWKEFVNYQNLF